MKKFCLFLFIGLVFYSFSFAKEKKKGSDVYNFKDTKIIKHTSVKDQGMTGTCWSFATISFLESEILRLGKYDDIDLSEMYIVRNVYPKKAKIYVRRHALANFEQGGQGHDVLKVLKNKGIAPQVVYPGDIKGQYTYNHGELINVLKGVLSGYQKGSRRSKLSSNWPLVLNSILDIYFGKLPEKFDYKGKEFTPKEFLQSTGINPDDYVEIISFSNHPFYKKVRLDVPDNWDYDSNYYNVPLDDLEKIALNAIKKGYTIGWDADMSDAFFNKKGVGVVPFKSQDKMDRKERMAPLKKVIKEAEINQELRQKDYNNYVTTDDHLMHIIGIAKEKKSNKIFFKVKNSWGNKGKYKGYQYVSIPYFRLRTVNIIVHKDSIPKDIREKLSL